jgi:hypothetical protein
MVQMNQQGRFTLIIKPGKSGHVWPKIGRDGVGWGPSIRESDKAVLEAVGPL